MKSVILLTLFCSVAFGAVLPEVHDMMHNMRDRQGSGGYEHVHGPEGHISTHTHGKHIHVHVDPHSSHHGHLKEAHCVMAPNTGLKKKSLITGHIHMRQVSHTRIRVDVSLHRLPISKGRTFALHVHESNNTKKSCNSLGEYYNPHSVDHDSRDDSHSHHHAGDWGNIQANADGSLKTLFFDSMATLHGPESIIGRSIVLHEGTGKRLACCIITGAAMDGMQRDGDGRMRRDTGHGMQSDNDHLHKHHGHHVHHGNNSHTHHHGYN